VHVTFRNPKSHYVKSNYLKLIYGTTTWWPKNARWSDVCEPDNIKGEVISEGFSSRPQVLSSKLLRLSSALRALLYTMDLILSICDDLLFDKLWARLVPLSAFPISAESLQSINSSSLIPSITSTSKWSQIVSFLPHPPLAADAMASIYTSSYSSTVASAWPRDYVPRQLLSLIILTLIGIHVLYFLFAWLSYKFIFNHDMMRHPRFLKDQVKLEIQCSLRAFPGMTLLTLPWFQAEVMGYSKLYDGADKYGYFYLVASVPLWVSLGGP